MAKDIQNSNPEAASRNNVIHSFSNQTLNIGTAVMTKSSSGKKLTVYGLLITILAMALATNAAAQASGEQLFQSKCSACHSIGGGRRVGPDLAGIGERRSVAWIGEFIKSSRTVVKSGDPEATALFEQYSGIIMPDFPLTDAQIAQILSHIANADSSTAAAVENTIGEPEAVQPLSEQSVLKGQGLFQGAIRLQNGGPGCNACHHVKNDAVIGGGNLAIELTTAFSRLGGSGIGAILGQAPFPVMQTAYMNNALTDDEITYLVAFLQDADEHHLLQQPRDYGFGLFTGGALGAGGIYLLFAFIWRGRKRDSVNRAIYDRQIKSKLDQGNT
jgi:mono/diheme cytochrome c family protein